MKTWTKRQQETVNAIYSFGYEKPTAHTPGYLVVIEWSPELEYKAKLAWYPDGTYFMAKAHWEGKPADTAQAALVNLYILLQENRDNA
jgi:alkylated DNA repair dioxygenase AlkB